MANGGYNGGYDRGNGGHGGPGVGPGGVGPGGPNDGYGRTPPQFTPSSYEVSHFGKRQRANSISGRLRSASDLLSAGHITSQQKGLIKDLIISSDPTLMAALEKHEQGDSEALNTLLMVSMVAVAHTRTSTHAY
jgi:hypothetical protein